MERLKSRESKVVTTRYLPKVAYNTVFSVLAMVHRQRLGLLHIQRSSPHVGNDIREGIGRMDYVAGSLDLFRKSPEQFHLRHSLSSMM